MPAHIHIEGVHPKLDGDHPMDASRFNNRELHTIKRLTGLRPAELEEAFDADDNDLLVALAVIALGRAGIEMGKEQENYIWEADVGRIALVVEEDADAVPPAQTPPEQKDEGGENKPSSGPPSSGGSDPLESRRSPTGTPASATGATSG